MGGGGRSEKIRTYNYKDNRVTDHRIKLTLHKLDRILMGDLDELTDALMADKRYRQLDEELTGPMARGTVPASDRAMTATEPQAGPRR